MTRREALLAGLAAPMALAATPSGPRLAPDREAMVPVPGGRIYVRVNGRLDGGSGGRPPLVLIHGGPGGSHWYFLAATALADERAVILYDQLDCGRSETPDDPANWRVERFVAELPAIAAHFGIARWHVLGSSWGGTVALEYGVSRPAALASLVLQSPLVATDAWLADAARLKAAMPGTVRDLLDRCDTPGAAPAADCQAATDAFYARHVRLRAPPPALDAYRRALPRPFSTGLYNHMWGRAEFTCTGTLRAYDGRPLLARLDGARTLFVAGEHDEAMPATVAGFARAAGAGFAAVPDAAHQIFTDNPAAYLDILRPWLRAHD